MDYFKKSFSVISKGKGAQTRYESNWDTTFGNNRCTWCNKKGATKRVLDAANVVHFFHRECWKEHISWP